MTDRTLQAPKRAGKTIENKARTLTAIQEEFARVMRLKNAAEEQRREELADEYTAFEEAELEYKELKKHLELCIAGALQTQDIARLNQQVDALKAEAEKVYEPLHGSTFRDRDGAGFQFRATVKTVIADEPALAKALVEQNLWQEIGASLSVSSTKAAQVLKTHGLHILPGLSVEPQITVAAYGPNNTNMEN
jgi:hypothetical protein